MVEKLRRRVARGHGLTDEEKERCPIRSGMTKRKRLPVGAGNDGVKIGAFTLWWRSQS